MRIPLNNRTRIFFYLSERSPPLPSGKRRKSNFSDTGETMRKALHKKLREAFISVMPVVAIVLLLAATPAVTLTRNEVTVFLVCAVFLIAGIALFNLGADMAMTPMGEHMGTGLTKAGNLNVILIASFLMGLFITVAEPDLSVLAGQVSCVMKPLLLIAVVGIGVGLFLLIAVLKIVFRKSLSSMLMLFYMLLFAISAILIENGKSAFLPLSFDSGGVTTGPITVPFIMALGVGIAMTVGGRDANENSFGLIALCSVGPMLSVLILSLGAKGELTFVLQDYSVPASLRDGIIETVGRTAVEVFRSLGLIALFFTIIQITVLKLPKASLARMAVGMTYTFIGLAVFLSAVSVGFMPVGFKIGRTLGENSRLPVIAVGFVIGLFVVLAEPAVHVLNKQVEEITGGTVTRRSMMIALSAGVGVSIALSVLRIYYGFSILYYLVPGYFLSLLLSLFVPKLYTAIAFDSGGVASGPLTSSFILPLMIGICVAVRGEENVLSYAFGVVAMVAMTPLITIQALGFKAIASRAVRERIVMKRILDADDEQIIYFDEQR